MNLTLAPVCLFVYKRLPETIKTIEALKRNFLASDTNLIVFSDAARGSGDQDAVDAVRSFIETIDGFRSVTLIKSEVNRGLARSIIGGVSEVLSRHGRVIVLEDDLVTSRNFLDFMNGALGFYERVGRVFAVSGYSYPLKSLRSSKYDNSFSYRSYSWGWATWQDRWSLVDWDMANYKEFLSDPKASVAFGRGGSDLPKMLQRQMNGEIDSWMIRWVFAQYHHGLLDVFPSRSKIQNVGFGQGATHTVCSDRRYRTILDESDRREFVYDPSPAIGPKVQSELEWKHSVVRRGLYKALDLVPFLP